MPKHNKVLLIYPEPDKQKENRFGYSLVQTYIISNLKKAGFCVRLIDYSFQEFNIKELLKIIKKINYVLIEFDSFALKRSMNLKRGKEIASIIKTNGKNIKTIAYGNHCTLEKKSIDNFDYTIVGEIEIKISKILKNIGNNNLQSRKIITVGNITDLNELPCSDRSKIDKIIHEFSENKLCSSALIETSRGCFGNCVFCQRKGLTKKVRYLNKRKVLNDFEKVVKNGNKNIWIVDDNFTANLKRAKEILKEIGKYNEKYKFKIVLSSWTKIDLEFLKIAKKSGVSVISFGIESRNEDILKFYKKKHDFAKFDRVLSFADEIGIFTIGNFIIGAPEENKYTIENTIKYALNSGLDKINVKMLDYMIGSELYESLSDNLKQKPHVFACSANNLTKYSREELLNIKREFKQKFSESRKIKLLKKIKKFGSPYCVKNSSM